MRTSACLLGVVCLLLAGAAPSGAQETAGPSEEASGLLGCDPESVSHALGHCAGLEALTAAASEAVVYPPYCRVEVDAVFWGGRQWQELAEALAADYSECAEYQVSIPPLDADHTMLRPPSAFNAVRALNPRVHPVAEIRFTGNRGWRAWVLANPARTFYGGGVEARRRMAQRGLDVTNGETWALNELSTEILEGVPGRREEILEFLRGLYDGVPGMPKARGILFNVFTPATDTQLAGYKEALKAWLADEAFWRGLDSYVDVFAQEVYASALNWGVDGVPLARRAAYLNDYFFHVTELAQDGPESVDAARSFLRRTYLPLANAAWPHPLIGDTHLISAETMSGFVSTQVYAIRHYANAHPHTGSQGRIGFGWAPNPGDPAYDPDGRDLIRQRLASAIHEAYEQGGNSQTGACGPPGEHVWCRGEVENAWLNDAWKIFSSWD